MTRRTTPPETLSPRAREIVSTARALLEEGGSEALSQRALAARLGIRATSLYNHFPDKSSLESALIASGLLELALALETAARDPGDPVGALGLAYRGYAHRHPHLFRLMTERPLPSELPPAMAHRVHAPFVVACAGDRSRAVALRGLIQGLVMLELTESVPIGDDIESAWRLGLSR